MPSDQSTLKISYMVSNLGNISDRELNGLRKMFVVKVDIMSNRDDQIDQPSLEYMIASIQ